MMPTTDPETVSLTLILSEDNPAAVGQLADSLAEPAGPAYGQYLTREALEELVALPADARQALGDWLASFGIAVVGAPAAPAQVLCAHGAYAQVAAAFGQDVVAWLQGKDDRRARRLVSALPRRLAGYVQRVEDLPGAHSFLTATPVTAPEPVHAPATGLASAAPPPELAGLTPDDVRAVYSVPPQWNGAGETIALMMLGGAIDASDLHAFAADVSLLVVNSHGRAAAYHLQGYVCQAGWDPVTGLGVPNVANLIAHLSRP